MWPHTQQPTRLPHPWDSPGKNTGVGCHFLLHCMKVKSGSEVAQSCLTLSDPMDRSPPGPSIHGIFQARVLEWGTIAFSMCLTQSCLKQFSTSIKWITLAAEFSAPGRVSSTFQAMRIINSWYNECPSCIHFLGCKANGKPHWSTTVDTPFALSQEQNEGKWRL